MAGIFVSDPERMSMQGTFPMFIDMEQKYGSLIRAAQAARRKPRPPNPKAAGSSMFNSLRHGLGTLTDALASSLKEDLLLNTKVSGIERPGPRWRVHTEGTVFEADDVVLAVPSFVAAQWIQPHDAALAADLASIRYVSTATVSLAFHREDIPLDLDGFGVLVPRSEGRRILACTWSSVKFKHRAPPGSALLRGFVGGGHQQELVERPDAELIEIVRTEFRELFGIHAEPLHTSISRWPRANPQYEVGHPARVREFERRIRLLGGLHLAGSPYHGVGMPDCVRSAQRAVDAILPVSTARKATTRGTTPGAKS